jgi:hypothetical protein
VSDRAAKDVRDVVPEVEATKPGGTDHSVILWVACEERFGEWLAGFFELFVGRDENLYQVWPKDNLAMPAPLPRLGPNVLRGRVPPDERLEDWKALQNGVL